MRRWPWDNIKGGSGSPAPGRNRLFERLVAFEEARAGAAVYFVEFCDRAVEPAPENRIVRIGVNIGGQTWQLSRN